MHKKPNQLSAWAKSLQDIHPMVVLLIILVFALLLRLILYTGPICCDQFDYAFLAKGASQGHVQVDFQSFRQATPRLALYVPIGFFYWLFGPSEFSTILFPLLASLLGIVFMYGIVYLLSGEKAGLIAAFIWASFPLGVFLSTTVNPDPVLAAFSLASVFFLILGTKRIGKNSILAYSGSVLFAILAILAKPLAVITALFIFLFFCLEFYRSKRARFIFFVKSHGNLINAFAYSTALIIIFFLLSVYVPLQSSPFILKLYRTATDLSSKFVLGTTMESFPLTGKSFETDLFLVSAPLFLVSIFGLIQKRSAVTSIVFLWLFTQLLYYEWGSVASNPLEYLPMDAARGDRNLLFVVAPFCAVAAIYLSRLFFLKESLRVCIFSACLIALPTAFLAKNAGWTGAFMNLISTCVMFTIIGSFVVPLLFRNTFSNRQREFGAGTLLILLTIGFLYPTTPFHISYSYWQIQQGYALDIRRAAEFLRQNSDLPILALSRHNAQELEFLSGFQLGLNDSLLRYEVPNARIKLADDPMTWGGSAYVYLRDEVDQFSPLPTNWWKVAEFETVDEDPIFIYRVLSAEDAQLNLENVQKEVAGSDRPADMERLLGAAVNALDPASAVQAWTSLDQTSPGSFSLDLIAPLLLNFAEEHPNSFDQNLLESVLADGKKPILADSELAAFVSIEPIDETSISLDLPDGLGGHFGVYEYITLESQTVYLFQINVKSTTGIDLVRVGNGAIGDSHDYSAIYEDWSEVSVIFLTPFWNHDQKVRFDYFTLNKAGEITVTNARLHKFDFVVN